MQTSDDAKLLQEPSVDNHDELSVLGSNRKQHILPSNAENIKSTDERAKGLWQQTLTRVEGETAKTPSIIKYDNGVNKSAKEVDDAFVKF